MPQRAPVGEISCPYVEESKATYVSSWDSVTAIPTGIAILLNSSTTLQTGNMWRYATDGS